jgi:hypothetical protein
LALDEEVQVELVREVVAKLTGNEEDIGRKEKILQMVVDGLSQGGKAQIQTALTAGRQPIGNEFSGLISKIRRMI